MFEALIRQHLESSLPPGLFWIPQNDFSDLIDALVDQFEPSYQLAVNTRNIRDPEESDRLLDLADEYAAEFFSNLTDDQIIALVKQAKKGVKEPGAGDLEAALVAAGFPVQVHSNSPFPTNPANFIGDNIPFMVAGNISSVAGNKMAQAGTHSGVDLLINGLVRATIPITQAVAGNQNMVAGNQKAVAGYFEETQEVDFSFLLPSDPDRWNQIYFIGGDDTRAPSGEITNIDFVDIDQERQTEFENLILKYGPGDGWAGLFINYV